MYSPVPASRTADLLSFCAIASVVFLCPVDIAQAQSTALEEVVVTAQKRETSLQDTPIAITAFSSDRLQALGAYNIRDIGEQSPNVTIQNSPGSTSTVNVSMRGIQAQEPSFTVDSKIGIYIDGVYYARISGALFDIAELERIEVLRGPQGTLWGRNTTGGAINIITAKPSGEFGFKQDLSFGNLDYYRSTTTVDTPAWAGLSAKLTYSASGRDGFIENDFPGISKDPGYEESDAYRIALRWQATDRLLADYAYDHYDSESVPRAFQLTAINSALAESPTAFIQGVGIIPNPYAEAAEEVAANRRDHVNLSFSNVDEMELQGHSLILSYQLDNAELKSITGYREYERLVTGLDSDGGSYDYPLFHATNDEEQQQLSQEFQLVGDLNEQSLRYVIGLYYFEEQSEVVNPQFLTPVVGSLGTGEPILFPVASILSYTADNRSRAVYGQLSYSPAWASRMTMTAGVRYTEDEREAELRSSDFKADDSWTSFNPAFTLEYAASDALNLYGTVSTGYNSGIFNIRATTLEAFSQPADAEEVINYELGIKSQWWDNRIRFNAAAFLMDYTELQVAQFQAGAGGATSILTNAGEAEIRGAEIELSLLPLPGLMVGFSWGYVDFEYKEFITEVDSSTGEEVDQADVAVPNGPENTGSLGLEYEIGQWDYGRLTGRLDLTYRDEIPAGPFAYPTTSTESHSLLSGRLTLSEIPMAGGQLRVALWGKNLTDEEYRSRGIDFGVDSGLGFAGASFSEPRTYGVDLSYVY